MADIPEDELPLLLALDSGEPPVNDHGPDCLHQLVEAQAARTPDKAAIVFGQELVTYRELDHRANRLARHLRFLGVGPEVPVAVCLQRTLDLVISLLAVLKAGGAYLPLDPRYPRERLRYMLEDSSPAAIVTSVGLADGLAVHDIHVVLLGDDALSDDGESLITGVALQNIAYLIYTSGSTGRPKAVAVEHGSVVAFARWARGVFSPDELAGVLAASSANFDLSVFELFVPLVSGGAVVLAETILDLPELPGASQVTLVNTTPSAMVELTRLKAIPPSVLTVNVAGEVATNCVVQGVYATATVRRVLNLYGPTECTVYSTFAEVEKGGEGDPTIGRPIDGTLVRLLDIGMEPVAEGDVGEIYIGGAGLARGYLRRPDFTAERFVPDPLARTSPGARLFRTGDLARRLPGGDLQYLGRFDSQVKMRGFRIELGEIENTLLLHPAIIEAAVVVRTGSREERSLVAYVVPKGEGEVATVRGLREFLKDRLPSYMVPRAYVYLPAMPLTLHGKVDRKALPEPGWEGRDDGSPRGEDGSPHDEVEAIVVQAWMEVFGIDHVGPTDGFFDLGGDSLLVTQVSSRLRQALGVELPYHRLLFQAPTPSGLATNIREALRSREHAASSGPIPRVHRLPEGLPLSSHQERLWFLYQLEPGSAAYNIPIIYALSGPLDTVALTRAFNGVVSRHEVLRTHFRVADGSPRQVIAQSGEHLMPQVDLSALSLEHRDAEADRLCAKDARRPFDLEIGPLLRTRLVRLAPTEHRLFVNVHHIVADGWSLDVLLRELATLYAGGTLPELPIQYADFAVWQRLSLAGEWMDRQLAYWRAHLAALTQLELPLDRPRGALRFLRGASPKTSA